MDGLIETLEKRELMEPAVPGQRASTRLKRLAGENGNKDLDGFESGLLKLDWLYSFVVLVECGSFSEAARRLYITQQALSKTFAQLEKQLETQLLQRRPW